MEKIKKAACKKEEVQKDQQKCKEDFNISALETGKKIGRRFKELREVMKMTQEEAAFYIEKNRTVISKLEKGDYSGLSLRDFLILSLIYGYYPGDLLNEVFSDNCDW